MRSFIAYVLLFAIMLPTLSPWGTIAYFQLNRSYIAKVLCENRDRPKLNCNGKCYLAKKLKQQQDKKDKETAQRVENMPIAQLFIAPFHAFTFPHTPQLPHCVTCFFYRLPVYNSPITRLLDPPQLG
ncbi:hypothetical protein [Dyadobacter sp.]|uniref:hypothetical protein n=1 Tax=Dyadobacter sp. TaxID=1914288 RepID=UPI003F701DCB